MKNRRMMKNVEINIEQIIGDDTLKPYFLDFIAKNFKKELYESCDNRFQSQVYAVRDCYESLSSLTELLSHHVPEGQVQQIINEVYEHYMAKAGSLFFKSEDAE